MKIFHLASLMGAAALCMGAHLNLLSYMVSATRPAIPVRTVLDRQNGSYIAEGTRSVLRHRQLSGSTSDLCPLIANFSSPHSCILIGAYFVRSSFDVGDVYHGTCVNNTPQYLGTLGNWFGFRQNFTWNRTSTDPWYFSLGNYSWEWTSSVTHNGSVQNLTHWIESTNLENSTQYIATNFTC